MIFNNQRNYRKGKGDREAHFDFPDLTFFSTCAVLDLTWKPLGFFFSLLSIKVNSQGRITKPKPYWSRNTSFPAVSRHVLQPGMLLFSMHVQKASTLHLWQTWLPLPSPCLSLLFKMSSGCTLLYHLHPLQEPWEPVPCNPLS